MGMQDGNRARNTLKLFVVLSECPHGRPDALDHQCIEPALMAPGQRPKFGGQREGQQKILSRHPFLKLAFQPVLALEVLTVRTVAVAARVRHRGVVVAGCTACPQPWALGRATDLHGGQRLTVRGQHLSLVLRQKIHFKALDDR